MTDPLFDLSGKVALVTGTSRGLGQHFARALARAGADVAMASRDKRSLLGFADEIGVMGRQTFLAALDVLDYNSIQSAVTAIEAHFGRIDILVNNAGCNIRKFALNVTWEDWNTVLDTNLRGSFLVAQAVARNSP
jgi:NAD(P)-dependent dehydrogenase (short-subunit alcohol dehydrogenase family)